MFKFIKTCGSALFAYLFNIIASIAFVWVIISLAEHLDMTGKVMSVLIMAHLIVALIFHASNLSDALMDYKYMRMQERADADFEARFVARFVADHDYDTEAGA